MEREDGEREELDDNERFAIRNGIKLITGNNFDVLEIPSRIGPSEGGIEADLNALSQHADEKSGDEEE